MKLSIKNIYIIIFFLFGNIVLGIVLVYLFFKIYDNTMFSAGNDLRTASLPFVNKQVEDINVNSKAFIIYEPESRVIVAGKNEHFRFSPASTAKIMTALIVLEEYNLGTLIKANGVSQVEGSKMKLEEGELISVESLLYGLLLPSGNDAAFVLSANYPGGYSKFVERMNAKAGKLNLTNTNFVDPSGYSDDNYTTAFDLVRLASEAMKNKKFREIVSTKETTVYDSAGLITHELENLNELLGQNGVNGIKTGYTEEAGGVLVSSILQGNKNYVVVVLNSPDRFGDTNSIINNALRNISLVSY